MNSRAALALTIAGGAAYALVSHQLMTRAAGSPWALAAVLGPIALGVLIGVWRSGQRVLAAALALAVVALAAFSARGEGIPPEWLYLAQHAGIHTGLGLWFGSTLMRGATPLISQIAGRVHGGLVPTMAHYTRQLTGAWTLYFFTMAAISLALFAWAPFAAWSLFANVLTPITLVLFFVGEYGLRYRLHPEFERVSLMEAVRAYSQHSESAAAPPRPVP